MNKIINLHLALNEVFKKVISHRLAYIANYALNFNLWQSFTDDVY